MIDFDEILSLVYIEFLFLVPNSPASHSLLPPTPTQPTNSIIKTTNFTDSIPISRSEVRHKTGIEIEVKQDKQPISPVSPTNHRLPTLHVEENSFSSLYQTPKRRLPAQHDQIQQLLHELTDCQVKD